MNKPPARGFTASEFEQRTQAVQKHMHDQKLAPVRGRGNKQRGHSKNT